MFQQGQTASFFFEIELLKDMEVLIGGLEILNDRGTIVHGKTTLEYGVSAPSRVLKGSRVRFRQDIDLEIAIGEYTFNFGLSTTSFDNYKNRSAISYRELDEKIVRLCILPNVGQFTVGFRKQGKPVQLLHHGIANLPGSCQIYLL
jgi:hypothetical protein